MHRIITNYLNRMVFPQCVAVFFMHSSLQDLGFSIICLCVCQRNPTSTNENEPDSTLYASTISIPQHRCLLADHVPPPINNNSTHVFHCSKVTFTLIFQRYNILVFLSRNYTMLTQVLDTFSSAIFGGYLPIARNRIVPYKRELMGCF